MIKIYETLDYDVDGFNTVKKTTFHIKPQWIEYFEVIASENSYNSNETEVDIYMHCGKVIRALFRTQEDLEKFLVEVYE